jgi:hypothetical protein
MSQFLNVLRILIVVGALAGTVRSELKPRLERTSLISNGVWRPEVAQDSPQDRGLRYVFTAIGIILLFAE